LLPAWALKTLATLLTGASAVAASAFVATHVKNPTAPLQPAVISHLDPAITVAPAGDRPVTSTYVS
jgi:hypothetical protein